MGWIVAAVIVGLILGVGAMLAIARPDSIRSRRQPPPKAPPKETVAPPPPATRHPQAKRRPKDEALSAPEPGPATLGTLPERRPAGEPPPDFPEAVLRAAWRRQGGLCAHCGRVLIWANRNRDSGIGAWQSHHRIPRDQGGRSDLNNCVLFCSGAGNCHFNVGHGGAAWSHYATLDDSRLLYLRSGAERPASTAAVPQARTGLIQQLFGISSPNKSRKSSGPKQPANRSRPPSALRDDYDEAY